MKSAFLTFAALFGIMVTAGGGLLQLHVARRMRDAGNESGAVVAAVLGGAGLVLALLTTIILLLR